MRQGCECARIRPHRTPIRSRRRTRCAIPAQGDQGASPRRRMHGPMVPDAASLTSSTAQADSPRRSPHPPRRRCRAALQEPPGWVREVDIVVVGSGIAGLTAALECRHLGTIMVVTKDEVRRLDALGAGWDRLGAGRGGHPPTAHRRHLGRGRWPLHRRAVRVLVTEGPDEVAKLINRGAEFDRDLAGRWLDELAGDNRKPDRARRRRCHRRGDRTHSSRSHCGSRDRDRRACVGP